MHKFVEQKTKLIKSGYHILAYILSRHNWRVLSLNVKKTQLLIFKAKKKKKKRQQVNISLDGSGIKQLESARF